MRSPLRRYGANLIRQLHYFEAVARHQSVRLAAEELGVSQSAVSHQLRSLADSLGEDLLVRSGRGVALTPAGERLAIRLATAFAGLQSSVDEIVGSGRQVLRLATCSSFGPGWLIERLQGFMQSHPEIELQLRLYATDPELTDQVADAFVTANPPRPGYKSIFIMDETLIAVRAPQGSIAKIGSQGFRLITTDVEEGHLGEDWRDYCRAAGVKLDDLRDGPWLQTTHYLFALEMAKHGLGLALVPDFLAKEAIEAKSLVPFGATRVPSGRAYHLCYKYSRDNETHIVAIAKWMKSQAGSSTVLAMERKSTFRVQKPGLAG